MAVTPQSLDKFLHSLNGYSDQNFTIEEVRSLEMHYELLVAATAMRGDARNRMAEFEFILVHLPDEKAIRMGLSLYLAIPADRLPEVETALRSYTPAGITFSYDVKVFNDENDISFNVSIGLVLPRVINRSTRDPLTLRIAASFGMLHIEWYNAARHIFAALGLPEDHGRPTKH